MLPVEHVELELILGLLELLMLQCSMLLETFQSLKQLDSTGLFAGSLSENGCGFAKIYPGTFQVKIRTKILYLEQFRVAPNFKNLRKYLKVTINICANNYLGLFYLLVAS